MNTKKHVHAQDRFGIFFEEVLRDRGSLQILRFNDSLLKIVKIPISNCTIKNRLANGIRMLYTGVNNQVSFSTIQTRIE